MNLLPVEIKVNAEGDVAAALSALGGPGGAMATRLIWFAEEAEGVAEGRLPLLDNGGIVRFRIGAAADDLTVKLRPCTVEQLVGRFSAAFKEESLTYRIEEDWSPAGRVLAASAVRTWPPGTLSDAVEPGADPAAPIDGTQKRFLHACGPAVPLDGLVALGPVLSAKAEDVRLDDLEVDLETWSAAGLEFLEVSLRVKPKDEDDAEKLKGRAERRQRKLEDAVREHGVALSENPENKTRRILAALAQAERTG
ncbi:hypothetical protein [Streptomyces sp. NPDC003522]